MKKSIKKWALFLITALFVMTGTAQASENYIGVQFGTVTGEAYMELWGFEETIDLNGGFSTMVSYKQQNEMVFIESALTASLSKSKKYGDDEDGYFADTFKVIDGTVNIGVTTYNNPINVYTFIGGGYSWVDFAGDTATGFVYQGGFGVTFDSPRKESNHKMRLQYKYQLTEYTESVNDEDFGSFSIDYGLKSHMITLGFDINIL